MAKRKTKEVPVEEVEIEEVETAEEEVAEEEVDLNELKERICEFYGISNDDLFNCDFAKYGVKKDEEKVLLEWVEVNKEVKSGDVVFDMYTTNLEAWAIIAKYGITPKDVAEGKMDELTEEEKEIITAYYNDLISQL